MGETLTKHRKKYAHLNKTDPDKNNFTQKSKRNTIKMFSF